MTSKAAAAHHEAGHAVIDCQLHMETGGASIKREDTWGGITFWSVVDVEALDNVTVLMAGAVAQARFSHCSIAGIWLGQHLCYKERGGPVEDDFTTILTFPGSIQKLAEKNTKFLVKANWPRIKAVAKVLIDQEEISGEEVLRICKETPV